jgi:uncharacterized delta-60 repeat protein
MFKPISKLLFLLGALVVPLFAQPELDITFNSTGRVQSDFGEGSAWANEVLVQPDNKAVAIGTWHSPNGNMYFALTRYNVDGSIDPSFGDNGRVSIDFNPNAVNEGATSGVLQPDGKIIAAGYMNIFSPGEGYFALARFNTDGSLDTSFGNGGKVLTAVYQHMTIARAVAIGQDGKIVAAGDYFNGLNIQTLIAQYHTNGTLEWTKTDSRGSLISDANVAQSVAVQPDGKVVTGGYFSQGGSTNITFVRYNANGSYDTSFGSEGRLLVSNTASEAIHAITVYPDGRILAVGTNGSDFLLLRMFGNGMFDISFSDDGRVATPMNGSAQASSVLIKPNGKIFVAGRSLPDNTQGFAVAAYNSDGSLDTSFSDDGKLLFGFDGFPEVEANSMAIDGLGRIVLGGTSNNKFTVARLYTAEPTPVTITGRTLTSNGQPISRITVGLTNQLGETRWAVTSNFGYYQFEGVSTGQAYTLFVRGAKRHTFASRVFGVNEAIDDLDLIGEQR